MKNLVLFFLTILFISCHQGNKEQENSSAVKSASMVNEEVLNIGKMHCEMCALYIENGLKSVEGVEFVKVNLGDSTALVKFDKSKTDINQFRKVIEKRGYILKNKDDI